MRVYDCFIYFNEEELLELRLNEHEHVVDAWVLVEATHTFAGKPKTAMLDLEDQRWSRFRDRIIHVIVDDMPMNVDAWGRERHQRNAIMRGLGECDPHDLVILGDADEILRPGAIEEFGRRLETGFAVPMLSFSYYHLNCRLYQIQEDGDEVWHQWSRTRVIRRGELTDPDRIRHAPVDQASLIVEDAGWHFSYMGGPERILLKIESFSHQELNQEKFTDLQVIAERIREKTDLFGREQLIRLQVTPIDESLPAYVLANQDRFAHLLERTTEPRADLRPSWKKLQDASIASYYAGNLDAGRLACDQLGSLVSPVPDETQALRRRNQVYYASPLAEQIDDVTAARVEISAPEGASFDAPLVAQQDGRCWLLVRRTEQDGESVVWHLGRLSDDLQSSEPVAMIPDAWFSPQQPGVRGLRCIPDGERTRAFGWVSPEGHSERWVLTGFDLDMTSSRLDAPRPTGAVVGACPATVWPVASRDGEAMALPSLGPTVVVTCSAENAAAPVEAVHGGPRVLEDLRGASALVPFGDGYLAVVRETIPFPDGEHVVHRFAAFGRSLAVEHLSFPFVFFDDREEECSGLALQGEQVVLSVGIGGSESWVFAAPLAGVEALLQPVSGIMLEGPYEWPAGSGVPETLLPDEADENRTSLLAVQSRERANAALPDVAERFPSHYALLAWLHDAIIPASYLEIGVADGRSLELSRCWSVGIDPAPRIEVDVDAGKPWCGVFTETSDDFFANHTPGDVLKGLPLDLAFIDGMHLFEFVLRDFINVEKWSHPGTMVLIHDVIPAAVVEAARDINYGDWVGDVWRFVACLRQWRPDVQTWLLPRTDVPVSGIFAISGLDPANTVLVDNFEAILRQAFEDPRPYADQIIRYLGESRFADIQEFQRSVLERRARGAAGEPATAGRSVESPIGAGLGDSWRSTGLRELLFHGEDVFRDFPLDDHPPDQQGWDSDAPVFERLISELRPRRIIEVGSWKGGSAITMARACQRLGLDQIEIVCVDTWLGGHENVATEDGRGFAAPARESRDLRRQFGYPRLYHTFLGNVIRAGVQDLITPCPMSSSAAAELLAAAKVTADLVFIDGGHEYQVVRSDLAGYWPLVKPGGVLFGHDYTYSEQVARAVDEFVRERGLALELDPPFFVLRAGAGRE